MFWFCNHQPSFSEISSLFASFLYTTIVTLPCTSAFFAVVAERLQPKVIVVYGSAPEDIFGKYRKAGIEIVQFDSDRLRA